MKTARYPGQSGTILGRHSLFKLMNSGTTILIALNVLVSKVNSFKRLRMLYSRINSFLHNLNSLL